MFNYVYYKINGIVMPRRGNEYSTGQYNNDARHYPRRITCIIIRGATTINGYMTCWCGAGGHDGRVVFTARAVYIPRLSIPWIFLTTSSTLTLPITFWTIEHALSSPSAICIGGGSTATAWPLLAAADRTAVSPEGSGLLPAHPIIMSCDARASSGVPSAGYATVTSVVYAITRATVLSAQRDAARALDGWV